MLLALILLGTGAQRVASQHPPATPPLQFKMMVTGYSDGDWIPVQYTCGVSDGSSPEVQWTDPPKGTLSLALIFHDTDAVPGRGAMDVTHWTLWNIPANTAQLPANFRPDTSPDGIQQGKNVQGVNGYQPPCPPAGAGTHHYVFELYAVDTKLNLPAGSSREDLLKAMDDHVIGKATHVGIFGQGIDPETWRWGITKLK
jgi:hypothetical protein